LEGRIIQI